MASGFRCSLTGLPPPILPYFAVKEGGLEDDQGDNLVKVMVKHGKIPKNDGLSSGKQT